MKGLLVSGGNKISEEILIRESKDSYIVCADCGIRNFYNTDIRPDLLVGDLDSIDDKGLEFIEKNRIKTEKFPPKKNMTDTELALSYLADRNCSEITILSATGTRLDHTVSNIFLLEYLHSRNIKSRIIDNFNEIEFREEEEFTAEKKDYRYLSVISVTDSAVYSTEGMEYETDHLVIKRYSARGVSNEIKKDSAKIKIHSGKVLIIKSND